MRRRRLPGAVGCFSRRIEFRQGSPRPIRTGMRDATISDHIGRSGRGQPQILLIEFRNGVLTVRFVGPSLGQREAPIASGELTEALQRHRSRITKLVLDLSHVQTMASLGLGLCIDARNTAISHGAEVVAYGLNEQLRELFRMMKLHRLFTMANSRAELNQALAA